jgi:DNA polymerase IIIc chi subunit
MTKVDVPLALIDAVRAEKKAKQERIDKLNAYFKKGFDNHVLILMNLVATDTITETEATDRFVAFIREQTELMQKAKNEVGPAVAKLTELVGRPSDDDDCEGSA